MTPWLKPRFCVWWKLCLHAAVTAPADQFLQLFKKMIWGSDIARTFIHSKKKNPQTSHKSSTPISASPVLDLVKYRNFVAHFDGTLNEYLLKKFPNVHIRLWNSCQVSPTHLTGVSRFLFRRCWSQKRKTWCGLSSQAQRFPSKSPRGRDNGCRIWMRKLGSFLSDSCKGRKLPTLPEFCVFTSSKSEKQILTDQLFSIPNVFVISGLYWLYVPILWLASENDMLPVKRQCYWLPVFALRVSQFGLELSSLFWHVWSAILS